MWLGAIIAGALLWLIHTKGFRQERESLLPYLLRYLIIAGILTPPLLVSGWLKIGRWREESPDDNHGARGRRTVVTAYKQSIFTLILAVFGGMTILAAIFGIVDALVGWTTGGHLLIFGIVGLCPHLQELCDSVRGSASISNPDQALHQVRRLDTGPNEAKMERRYDIG
jgi:hypothetical protein